MKFAVIGGDLRSALLCSMLAGDGHRVYSFALEKAELPPEVPKAGCIQGCTYGADCVILPCPAEKGGFLNAPFAAETHRMAEVCGALWPGQILCAGKLGDAATACAIEAGTQVEDIMLRQDFAVGNAAITAEGALGLLISGSDKTLWRRKALVLGWGRIGSILAQRLRALGADVYAAARKSRDRAMARAMGCHGLGFDELEGRIADFDYIINTIPARVLSDAALCCVRDDALLLELASQPGGFDRNLAENIGIRTIYAPGLPGKCAPYGATELMREAIYDVLNEQGE